MFLHEIRNDGDLVAYLTDCTLATVAHLAMKKSASKSELKRQISIAQTAINKSGGSGIFKGTRGESVIKDFGGDVAAWASKYKA